MLFNSAEFLLAFLPVCFFVYFWLNEHRFVLVGKVWLVVTSLFFYGWWDPAYVPLLVASILINFGIGSRLTEASAAGKTPNRPLLVCGIAFNLAILCYFKYASFLVVNVNAVTGSGFSLPSIVLPLAVSFFTFTQIAYLVDSHRGQAKEYDLLNYFLFVTFFPHLIAGPILHHKEMMPQFGSRQALVIRYPNVAMGLFLLSIGLFKKVVIADTFAKLATAGFDQAVSLNFFEAWITSLSYTFQLYFDFSGYTDMAIGSALLFNIRLPINFNSPYKALDIQDFWRRWHITLSRFLRDYLYFPLGGNQHGTSRTLANLLLTFTLGGLWHGASWMFVVWGALHGTAMVLHRVWRGFGVSIPGWLGWMITFNFVNAAWVFFRAKELKDSMKVLRGMAGLNGVMFPSQLADWIPALKASGLAFGPWILGIGADYRSLVALLGALILVVGFRNTNQLVPFTGHASVFQYKWSVLCAVMASISLVAVLASAYTEFIYFNF